MLNAKGVMPNQLSRSKKQHTRFIEMDPGFWTGF